MSADSYVREINSLDAEIKRLNAHVKRLREQKRQAQTNLHGYMVSHGLEKVGEGKNAITISKCAPPKPRRKPKPKKERVAEAIELFRDAGIPNPDEFYAQFEATQKSTPGESVDNTSPQKTKSKGKGKGGYDEMLGF